MPIDLQLTLARGDRAMIDLLEYCVITVRMDPIFLFLVSEYRLRPTPEGAVALYDLFCGPQAPGRISAVDVLPPRNPALAQSIELLRRFRLGGGPPRAAETETTTDDSPGTGLRRDPRPVAAQYLFDAIAARLQAPPSEQIDQVQQAYDPALDPYENLPDGGMNAAQRNFVDRVWQATIRPQLVAAGFRRIANIA